MIAIAIHGGAGKLPFLGMTPEKEEEYERALEKSVSKSYSILEKGGSAVEAVVAAVAVLEDSALFNAGKGSAFTQAGTHEMDAAVMCGKTQRAGAVCIIKNIKNPILLAHAVMHHSNALFLAGKTAEELGREMGLESVPNDYFFTEEKYQLWLHTRQMGVPTAADQIKTDSGTVGAVALDKSGNLAAATSTGGLTNKPTDRISDSAIIGAGTYAKNSTCAVSCSGDGEYIMRALAAHEVSCLLEFNRISLNEACDMVMQKRLTPFGGEAGLVAIDSYGNIKYIFNTPRMYRGWKKSGELLEVALY